MMRTKESYSNKIVIYLGVLIIAVSCNLNKEIAFENIYKDRLAGNANYRSITQAKSYLFFGGSDGWITFLDLASGKKDSTQLYGVEDFRDLHFSKENILLAMNAGTDGQIWGLPRPGQEDLIQVWSKVFLNGMDFNAENGFVFGDQVNNHLFIAKSKDNGASWEEIPAKNIPHALENESGFAASGSSIQIVADSTVYIGTGNANISRLYRSNDLGENWSVFDTPMRAGESFGIYSLYFWNKNEGVIIGGSYLDSLYNKDICQYTTDGGKTWKNRSKGLPGYCSIVTGKSDGSLLVASGRSGTFYSANKGKTWELLTEEAYYTAKIIDEIVVLAGAKGKMEIFQFSFSSKKVK